MLSFKLCILVVLFMVSVAQDKQKFIVDSYNAQKYDSIYENFDPTLQKSIQKKAFHDQMTAVRNYLGEFKDHFNIDEGQLFFVAYNDLNTGLVRYSINKKGLFTSFYINYFMKSTFKFLLENKNQPTIALAFKTSNHSFSMNQINSLSLCSVYKITLVIEYARQVTSKIVNPTFCVDLSNLNQYFLPHIDVGHSVWLKTIKKTCATHQQIVVGMIKYSSNANAQFLTDLLTPKKVDQLVTEFGLNQSKTLYVASSMLAMNNTFELPREQYLNLLKLMTEAEIRNLSQQIHTKLKNRTINLNKDEFYLDPEIIDIHVDLLQRSTARDYLNLMQAVNQNKFFDNQTLATIKMVFDKVDRVSNFSINHFVHAGAKGGSANFKGMKNAALAVAGYEQKKDGQRISYCLILNGLSSQVFGERLQDLDMFLTAIGMSQYYVSQFVRRMKKQSLADDVGHLREYSE